MRNNKPIEDTAKRLISEVMARSSPMFNQNLETPGCLIKLQPAPTLLRNYIEVSKENENQLEPECIDSTTTCQIPRKSQTRSTELLKKSSRISTSSKYPQQQHNVLNNQPSKYPQLQNWICLSLDLRMTMKRGLRYLPELRLPSQSKSQRKQSTQRKRAQLQRIRFSTLEDSACCKEYDLPGPLSRDDDEDSSPLIQVRHHYFFSGDDSHSLFTTHSVRHHDPSVMMT